MVIVLVYRIKAVGVGRVHPPGIGIGIEQTGEMAPIDFTGLGAEGIIDADARRIVHPRWPGRQSALRPCLEVIEQPQGVELPVLLGLGTEACPNRNHEVSMLTVYLVNHLLAVEEVIVQELHCVPRIVRAPILPVLDNAVEGHLRLTVLVEHGKQLTRCLITLLRLPVAVGPEGEHRHLSGERAHLGNVAIGRATQHEIVVHSIAHLRRKRHSHALGRLVVDSTGVVVPVDGPAADALEHVLEVLQVRLLHVYMLAAMRQLTVLKGA